MVKIKKQPASHTDVAPVATGGGQVASAKKKAGRPREIHYAMEKKFTLMLPKDVHKGLKVKSAELETPMTTMIIDAIKKTYDI